MSLSLFLASCGFIGICLFVETSSWVIRSFASRVSEEASGRFISRTNIYLYGGRLFSLLFSVCASFMVDKGSSASNITVFVAASIFFAALLHLLLIFENKIPFKIAGFLGLPVSTSREFFKLNNIKLFCNTAFSAIFFTFAMALPYAMGSLFSEMRMTISNIGQLINSLGTLLLLFIVDPILYGAMDRKELDKMVASYVFGRFFGFLVGAILLVGLSLFL